MKNYPLITVAIPTYNSHETLDKCLRSIYQQSYLQTKLQIIVVDNYSDDNSLEIAQKYPVEILMNTVKNSQVSKMMALRKAKGEYFIYFDSDIDIVGKNWFQEALKPLQENREIVASFPVFAATASDNPLVRYLSYDSLQRDPIYEFFSPSVESTIVSKKSTYFVCKYQIGKIPPSGLCFYKTQALRSIWDINNEREFMELDNLVRLVRAGYKYFAFTPKIKIHHPFVNSLGDLLRKRMRNIKRNYLHQSTPRLYRWFDLTTLIGILKVFIWVVYATTIILPTIRASYKCLKNKDLACMNEPLVALTETWVIIFSFIWYSIVD